jgi:hypothetical protein
MGRYYKRYRNKYSLSFFELIIIAYFKLIIWAISLAFKLLYRIVTHIFDLFKKENNNTVFTHDLDIESSLPYEKKLSQVTESEKVFYKVLDQVVAGRYDIQRQVLLSTLVNITSKNYVDYSTGREFNPDRSKIDRKTIDFVLFNKGDLSPYVAIELDDASHLRIDRIKRDKLVENILAETGIRLIRIKNSYSYSADNIKQALNI